MIPVIIRPMMVMTLIEQNLVTEDQPTVRLRGGRSLIPELHLTVNPSTAEVHRQDDDEQ